MCIRDRYSRLRVRSAEVFSYESPLRDGDATLPRGREIWERSSAALLSTKFLTYGFHCEFRCLPYLFSLDSRLAIYALSVIAMRKVSHEADMVMLGDAGLHRFRVHPVSYTHLDVYKRQPFIRSNRIACGTIGTRNAPTGKPVSYTHLDVYKRQP